MDTILHCQKFDVVRIPVRSVRGGESHHEIVVHPGVVVVLPLLDKGHRVVMIRNHRHAIDRELWELPAGTLDCPTESAAETAGRELEEETGYRAKRIAPLCRFYTSPGITTELIQAFVATDLTKAQQRLGPTEFIRVDVLDREEAIRMIRNDQIVDGKTIVTLLRWRLDEEARDELE